MGYSHVALIGLYAWDWEFQDTVWWGHEQIPFMKRRCDNNIEGECYSM